MDYAIVKLVHQAAVAVSITGFVARGAGGLAGAAWTQGRAAKRLPHLVDTVLLVSAATLAWKLRLDPLATPWLAAKIGGLLLYIGLGVVALRAELPRSTRAAAWAAALFTVGWIVSVAITKQAAGLFGSG